MEGQAVVKALPHELFKVFAGLRRGGGVQLDVDGLAVFHSDADHVHFSFFVGSWAGGVPLRSVLGPGSIVAAAQQADHVALRQNAHPVLQRAGHIQGAALFRLFEQRERAAVALFAGGRVGPVVGQVQRQRARADMPGEEAAPAEKRFRHIERRAAHAVAAGEQPPHAVEVVKRIGQAFGRNLQPVGFIQRGPQQRGDFGQVLAGQQRAAVVGRDQRDAGVLRMQGGVERDFKIPVPALARIRHARLADSRHIRVQQRIGRIMAQKAERIFDLCAGLDMAQKALQERAGGLRVHALAKGGQVGAAPGRALPHLKAEKDVRTVGPGGKRRRVADLVMDRGGRLAGGAHMGITFRHEDPLLAAKQGIRPGRPHTPLLYCAVSKKSNTAAHFHIGGPTPAAPGAHFLSASVLGSTKK